MQKLNNIVPIIVHYDLNDRNFEIKNYLNELDKIFNKVILVENNSIDSLKLLCDKISSVIYIHNANRAGLAGAYNSAIDYVKDFLFGIEYILFLDDDTNIFDLNLNDYVEKLISIQKRTGAAAIAGRYQDVNSGTRCNFLRLDRWRCERVADKGLVEQVTFIINSMSIWQFRDLLLLGKFNEELMVDHIDSEMCLRAYENGLVIKADYSIIFNHQIGKRLKYSIFGMNFNSGNHSVSRRYMIGRATSYLLRSRFQSWPAVSLLMMQRTIYEILGILVVEKNKFKKIMAFIRGFYYGCTKHYKVIKYYDFKNE